MACRVDSNDDSVQLPAPFPYFYLESHEKGHGQDTA